MLKIHQPYPLMKNRPISYFWKVLSGRVSCNWNVLALNTVWALINCQPHHALTDFLSGNRSGGLLRMDWWTPARTHASLSAPSQYPREIKGDRRRERWHEGCINNQFVWSIELVCGQTDRWRHTMLRIKYAVILKNNCHNLTLWTVLD